MPADDGAIAKTLANAAIAFALSVVAGLAAGVFNHKFRLLQKALDSLFATYYAVPEFAFYPLLIVLFGAWRHSTNHQVKRLSGTACRRAAWQAIVGRQ